MSKPFQSTFNPELALQIIERVADGETLGEICRGKPGMPHPNTFKRWCLNNTELGRAYSLAIQMSAASLEEEALTVARQISKAQRDGTQVRAFEVLLGQLRWSAERRDPAKYGTKSQVSVKVPIQIITPLGLGGSEPSAHDIYNIEATAVKQIEEVPEGVPIQQQADRRLGPKKRVLTPRQPQRRLNFGQIARGVRDEHEATGEEPLKASPVREAGGEGGGGEEH